MMGYITAKEAKALGYTNHGKYFGIPIWIGDVYDEAPLVAAKFLPFEFVLYALHFLFAVHVAIFFPDEEPMFRFLVGKRL